MFSTLMKMISSKGTHYCYGRSLQVSALPLHAHTSSDNSAVTVLFLNTPLWRWTNNVCSTSHTPAGGRRCSHDKETKQTRYRNTSLELGTHTQSSTSRTQWQVSVYFRMKLLFYIVLKLFSFLTTLPTKLRMVHYTYNKSKNEKRFHIQGPLKSIKSPNPSKRITVVPLMFI